MPDRIIFSTTEANEKSSGFNGFPFPIPDLAEDNQPFKEWNGSFCFDVATGWDGSKYTSGDLTRPPPPRYLSNSTSTGVSSAGPNSLFCIGPFTHSEAVKLFWQIQKFKVNLQDNVSAECDGVSWNKRVSAEIELVRSYIKDSSLLDIESENKLIVPDDCKTGTVGSLFGRSIPISGKFTSGLNLSDSTQSSTSDAGHSYFGGGPGTIFFGDVTVGPTWNIGSCPVKKENEYWFHPRPFIQWTRHDLFATKYSIPGSLPGSPDSLAKAVSSVKRFDYSEASTWPQKSRFHGWQSLFLVVSYKQEKNETKDNLKIIFKGIKDDGGDIQCSVPSLYQKYGEGQLTSNPVITITPKKYFAYANSKGAAVYDTTTGKQLVDPAS